MGGKMRRFAWAASFVAAARPVARDVCARSTVRARPARAEVGVGARGEFSRFAGRTSPVARRSPVHCDISSNATVEPVRASCSIFVRGKLSRFANRACPVA